MLNWVKVPGVTLLMAAAIGCGGSSGGGVTNVPPTTKLMTLTPAQKTQLCSDMLAYDARTISNGEFCKMQGIIGAQVGLEAAPTSSDAELQTFCSGTVTDCNAGPFEPGACPVGDSSTCTEDATIADLSLCFADNEAALKGFIASLPDCSGVTKTWLNTNASSFANGPPPPASCTALAAKCPNILM